MRSATRAIVLFAALIPSSVALAKDPCDGVKIEADDFGDQVWKLDLNLGTFALFQIKQGAGGLSLETVTGEYNLSTASAPPGSVAELVLADGTHFSHTLSTTAPPTLMSNGSGTVWAMSFPLTVPDLQHLANSPVTASRIQTGNTSIGGAKIYLGSWAKKLQGAAACFVSRNTGGSAAAAAPAAAASSPKPSGGISGSSSSSASSSSAAAAPAAAPAPAPSLDPEPTELGDNMLGGRVVTHNQLVGTFGYPDLEVGVHLPLFHKFDLTPTFRFAYGQALSPGVPSLALGVQARWQLLEAGDLTGSLVASEPLTIGLPPFGYASGFGGLGYGVSFGLGLLHPGFMMTYVIADKVDLDFGLQFNDDLVFGGGTVTFVGSVPVIAGAEANITKTLRVGGRMEGGPYFAAGPGGVFVTGYVRVVAGVGWTF